MKNTIYDNPAQSYQRQIGQVFLDLCKQHDIEAECLFENPLCGKSFERDETRMRFKLDIKPKRLYCFNLPNYENFFERTVEVVANDIFQAMTHSILFQFPSLVLAPDQLINYCHAVGEYDEDGLEKVIELSRQFKKRRAYIEEHGFTIAEDSIEQRGASDSATS